MSIEVRKYQSSDRNAVVLLWNVVFPNSTGHNDPDASIDRKCAHDDGLFFVAEDSGEVVGTAMGGYDGHRGWIYSLAVLPTRQRQGIGRLLIQHTEGALAQLGCPKVNLQVRSDNAEIVEFYHSLGYETEQRVSMGKRIDEGES
ncbi:Acetyltransferase YpeA [Thalassoglobus neptunius]|uniref:Acetyltransferase YpeA n=1 Tax=Thalassoglobus neptunius TaxID=1938619 RepID=A0A5C5W8L9_9PLAN|nr:GNAT family acetyltransferase [Thalassoglobus neptunius]TWT46379.1 Acetyltransferase YpeA [Thalassoglobus neptunius]